MSKSITSFSWNKADWAGLSEMAEGFDEYRPALSRKLSGQVIRIVYWSTECPESTFAMTHSFNDDKLEWVLEDANGVRRGSAYYELFEMQPGLFFLHYLRTEEDHPVVVTMALDIVSGQATGAVGELGLGTSPHLAHQHWFQGYVAGTESSKTGSHERTRELIGHRIRYSYSVTVAS